MFGYRQKDGGSFTSNQIYDESRTKARSAETLEQGFLGFLQKKICGTIKNNNLNLWENYEEQGTVEIRDSDSHQRAVGHRNRTGRDKLHGVKRKGARRDSGTLIHFHLTV